MNKGKIIITLHFFLRLMRMTYEQHRKTMMREYTQFVRLRKKRNVLLTLLPNKQKWGSKMNLKKFSALLNLLANFLRCC